MEDLMIPPQMQFFDNVQGCLYEIKSDAIEQVIDATGRTLFNILHKEGTYYSVSAEVIIERKKDLLEAMKRFQIALNSPELLISEYKLVKKK